MQARQAPGIQRGALYGLVSALNTLYYDNQRPPALVCIHLQASKDTENQNTDQNKTLKRMDHD